MSGRPFSPRRKAPTPRPAAATASTVTVQMMRQSDIMACPFLILVPSHYREDGSCKCDDAEEQAMMIKHWGYKARDFVRAGKRPT